jgi:integrase
MHRFAFGVGVERCAAIVAELQREASSRSKAFQHFVQRLSNSEGVMASIRKREGRWQARVIRKGYKPTAKTFDTKQDAEKWGRSVEREIDRGSFLDKTVLQQLTFGDLLKRYREKVTPSKRGKRNEEYLLLAIEKAPIAMINIGSLTVADFVSYRDERLTKVSSGTVQRALAVMVAAINHARREWLIPISPDITNFRKPSSGKPRERILEPDEENRLLQELSPGGEVRNKQGQFSGPRNFWIGPLVEFDLETAMRRGEILGLRWEHIDFTKRTAYLPMTKNGCSRTVPLSSKAVAVLKTLPRSINGRVFPLTAPQIRDCFNRACRRAGLKNFRFHDLRHTAITRLASRLPNVIELAAVSGHRDLKMLARYYHTKPEDLARKLG